MENQQYKNSAISTTDEMAFIRTKLANERTFLAYVRTVIGIFAAGVGLIKFTGSLFFVYIGFFLVILSPCILILGIYRFIRVKHILTLSVFQKISNTLKSDKK